MAFERVAVTGVGVVSALGYGAAATFDRLVAGERGIRELRLFDALDARCRLAAEVPDLDVRAVAPPDEAEHWSRSDALAVLAAREALAQAGARGGRLGVSLGGTTGGMLETEGGLLAGPLDRVEPARVEPLLSYPLDVTTERVGRAVGAVRFSTVCAACASGALALVEAVEWLASGSVERVIAGGSDGLCRLTFFGFDSLGALATEPCRPFDRRRAGLSLGEAAAFLVLERESTARARGAEILAFLSGAATGAEAHHITHPEPSGAHASKLVRRALSSAGLGPSDIDYVNAHGTGTLQNDAMEAKALLDALGGEAGRVFVSSSKGQLGHTLGAAGAVEAVACVLALQRGVVPPTGGLEEPEVPGLRHVFTRGVPAPLRSALSGSFGFGGTGAVLVFEQAAAARREQRRDRARAVAITGACAVSAAGVLASTQACEQLLGGARGSGGPIAPDPLAALDPERSRRFDRHAALVTLGAERALADAAAAPEGIGLVVGTAFGSVERSVRFVLRAADRGVRRANPADFPHLVASASSGNGSIYLGLTGAALCCSDGAASYAAALASALAFLATGQAGAVLAGGAEGFDPVVAEVLGKASGAPRSEGAGFVLLEGAEAAQARGARVLSWIEGSWLAPFGSRLDDCVRAPSSTRCRVVIDAPSAELGRALDASRWGASARSSVVEAAGLHEALGALALVTAVGLIAGEAADEVLVASMGRVGPRLTLLCREEPRR
ncbi:MAG TPA: beta-ketoacyl-[acyl-carrier-protein] synthase family protein [Polyangiaceae bacterium]